MDSLKLTGPGGFLFTHKAKLNAAYNGQTTTKPVQWDAKLNKLPEDFRLTSGSTVNVFVTGIPYSGSMGAGVSLRLKMVQVIKFVLLMLSYFVF